jgi:hypothetical protein
MTDAAPGTLPVIGRTWWRWVIGGAVYGVLLRVLFGVLELSPDGVMSAAFLLGTPFVLGALTVYGRRHEPRTWVTLIVVPWVTVGLMLIGCAIALLEGSICLAIMSPLFLALGSLGGLAMGLALKMLGGHRTELRAVAALPLLLILFDHQSPPQDVRQVIRRSVVVDAAPAVVWNEILDARAIRADELPWSLTHAIGVPKPLEGVNVLSPSGEVRFSKWERGVHFRGVVTRRQPQRSITWRYVFDRDSFPAGSMDDHVAIGGRYFDLHDTTFNLQPLVDGRTRLEIVAHYRVSSSINFYAIPVASLIGVDFVDTILGLYKGRSERHAQRGS